MNLVKVIADLDQRIEHQIARIAELSSVEKVNNELLAEIHDSVIALSQVKSSLQSIQDALFAKLLGE